MHIFSYDFSRLDPKQKIHLLGECSVPVNDYFIITSSFEALLKAIKSGKQNFTLVGPSGTGKSSYLTALWYYYKYVEADSFVPIICSISTLTKLYLQVPGIKGTLYSKYCRVPPTTPPPPPTLHFTGARLYDNMHCTVSGSKMEGELLDIF